MRRERVDVLERVDVVGLEQEERPLEQKQTTLVVNKARLSLLLLLLLGLRLLLLLLFVLADAV